MAHIRKLKNNTFQAAVYVGTSAELDKKGKPKKIYEYITCTTEKECKVRARELETDIENRTYSSLGNVKFNAWVDKWMEVNFIDYSNKNVKPGRYKPSTQVSYKMYIETHFKPFFKRFKLKDVQEMHIKEYMTKKLNTGLSPTTIRKHFYILSDIFYDALKIKSPCRDVEPPKLKKYKPQILTEEGFDLMRNALKGTWDEIPLLLAAYCGMREGEIFALKWDDIDDKNELITVDETRAISEDGYIDGDPKSERGIRIIAAPDFLFSLIEKHRLTQKKISHYLFDMRPDSYSERFGKLIDRHNSAIKRLRSGKSVMEDYTIKFEHKRKVQFTPQKKPLPDVRFHDLRHYHATILHKNGVSDQYAADRLGHDIMVLKKIYQHLELGTKKAIDEKVKQIFKS